MVRIGIRREDKNDFERRVPLIPNHVQALVAQGIEVHIQPSRIRVFTDDEYRAAGATLSEDLSGCPVTFGIKEMPADFFHPGGAYMFFSHTFKGQPYNMPMLARLVERRATLIDYETVTDAQNRRVVFFGDYAGTAGMFETLYTLGKRLESEGIWTPFADLRRPMEYGSLEDAKQALRFAGERIRAGELPASVSPVIVGFSGYGNVSRGAQEILDLLPNKLIRPEDLNHHMQGGSPSSHLLYKVVFEERHMVRPREAGYAFDLQDYYRHPEKYQADFEKYLPCLTALVNCIYWDARYPRLVTKDWVRRAWSGATPPKLRVIGDISCDIEGSIECTVKATEPGDPVYTYIASDGRVASGWLGAGPVIMAVDTLPSELPREASTSFAEMLMPFVPAIARADFTKSFDGLALPDEIRRAVIVHKGEFAPAYKYMEKFLS